MRGQRICPWCRLPHQSGDKFVNCTDQPLLLVCVCPDPDWDGLECRHCHRKPLTRMHVQ